MKIGIDAGGTLIKAAYTFQGNIYYRKWPAVELAAVAEWVNASGSVNVALTGGKAQMLMSKLRVPASVMVEFEATCSGVRYMLEQQGTDEKSYILTNVGTGTSIHYVQPHEQKRIGGTGVGGGALMGLSRLLTGKTDYEDIIALAATGERDSIDLKVKHIYEGSEPPIPGDLTASNFGKILALSEIDSIPAKDLLASVIGLVGETAATTSVLAAAGHGVSSVIYVGSSFIRNTLLMDVVERYTRLRGANPVFLVNGEYCGAVGAMLSETNESLQ